MPISWKTKREVATGESSRQDPSSLTLLLDDANKREAKDDKKQVLRKKVKKFLKRGYVAPYQRRTSLLIKYFAVPKGIINGVV